MMRLFNNSFKIRAGIYSLFLLSMPLFVLAEITAKESTRLRMNYVKMENGDKKISALLTSGRGKNMAQISDADITFKASNEDTTVLLTKMKTDANGMAELYVEAGYTFPVDEEGFTEIAASYRGCDTLKASSGDLRVKDIFISLSFDLVDSVKIITVRAYELNMDGEEVPPAEPVDIIIGVKRLYSTLTIDEIETDDDGMAELEFPNDIPGDAEGLLNILAKIEENETFATVYKSGEAKWGTPVDYTLTKLPRQLFTDEAPLWMIAAVFIILAGAWYHFFLSIFKLNKIRHITDEK